MFTRIILLISLIIVLISQTYLSEKFVFPFKDADITLPENKLPLEKYLLLDLTGIVFGMRKLASDIAWIRVLQYYGSSEEECDEGETEHGHSHEHCHHGADYGRGKYYDLLKLCQRVVRLDPYFNYAYLYGGASLAWNLNRTDEGLLLLEEGRKRNPEYWQFYLYIGAIVYKKQAQYEKMVQLLERALAQPDCPLTVKAILANIYSKAGNYRRALEIWREIYESGESEYYEYSQKQINKLQTKTPR